MDRLRQQSSGRVTSRALHLPIHPERAAAREAAFSEVADEANRAFRPSPAQQELINDFRTRRQRTASQRRLASSSYGGDVYAAIPRFYDPTDYWSVTNIPYDMSKDSHRFRLYQWLDLFYRTHFLIPILVDIFTRFPLVGMELHSKDQKLADFYTDAFMDRLDYEQFMVDMGREYWTFGQAFPLGSFNETLGVWEREELLDPTLVKVQHVPLLGDTQFMLAPPPDLVQAVKSGEPKEVVWRLKEEFPDLLPYLRNERDIPVSDVLLKQVAFKVSPRDTHGTPILLRALRTLMHEEKLLAAQDAIAERLYSPLIMAKLGTPDLGDGEGPWIPGQGEIAAFRDDLDIALASDFRLIVHHFGVEVSNVFGREQMPRLDQDFDRVERNLMMTFGMNPSLLAGGSKSGGQPYATSALNAELMNQLLRTYQGFLKKHLRLRMEMVAEAQEHYDYEKRGQTRIPIMEEVIEYDEEGNPTIVEKNKLLVPELRMKAFDLRDEATQRQWMTQMKGMGIAVSDQTMSMGANFNVEEELERMQEEIVQKTVAQQEAKVQAYRILSAKGLPIPPDLRAEIEGPAQPQAGQGGEFGVDVPPRGPGGAQVDVPSPGEPIIMPPPPGEEGGMGGPMAPGGAPGAMPEMGGPPGAAPDVSFERMRGPGLPTPPGSPGGLGRPRGASVEEEAEPEVPDSELPWDNTERILINEGQPKTRQSSATVNPLVSEPLVDDEDTDTDND